MIQAKLKLHIYGTGINIILSRLMKLEQSIQKYGLTPVPVNLFI